MPIHFFYMRKCKNKHCQTILYQDNAQKKDLALFCEDCQKENEQEIAKRNKIIEFNKNLMTKTS